MSDYLNLSVTDFTFYIAHFSHSFHICMHYLLNYITVFVNISSFEIFSTLVDVSSTYICLLRCTSSLEVQSIHIYLLHRTGRATVLTFDFHSTYICVLHHTEMSQYSHLSPVSFRDVHSSYICVLHCTEMSTVLIFVSYIVQRFPQYAHLCPTSYRVHIIYICLLHCISSLEIQGIQICLLHCSGRSTVLTFVSYIVQRCPQYLPLCPTSHRDVTVLAFVHYVICFTCRY